MADSLFGRTLPQVEKDILKYQRLLSSSRRFDRRRPTYLIRLAELRTLRNTLTHQVEIGDLDKSIAHLTDAVLHPFQSNQNVVYLFFQLATALLLRFDRYNQPEDVKSSLKYLRFLRINFHPLEVFVISHVRIPLFLVRALAGNLISGSGDIVQDLEEMAALVHELLSSDISMSDLITPINAFSQAVGMATFNLEVANLPLEQVIQVLREAEMKVPNPAASLALASCLAYRFQAAHVIDDYEQAIAIADQIVTAHSPGDSPKATQIWINTIRLIKRLVISRFDSYRIPEYLEDAICRLRTLLSLPSFPDEDRFRFTVFLEHYVQERSRYFGVSGTPPNPRRSRVTWVQSDNTGPEASSRKIREGHLKEIFFAISDDEIMDVEAAVERSRTLLPSQHSSDLLSCASAIHFAHILFQAHRRTNRLDYLNEAIVEVRRAQWRSRVETREEARNLYLWFLVVTIFTLG